MLLPMRLRVQPKQHSVVIAVLSLLGGIACSASHVPADGGPDATSTDGGPDAGTSDGGVGDTGLDGGQDGGRDDAFFTYCIEATRLACEGGRDCCTQEDRRATDCTNAGRSCATTAEDLALQSGLLRFDAEAAANRLEELRDAIATCAAVERRRFFWEGILVGTLLLGAECTPSAPGLLSIGRLACSPGLRCELSGTASSYTGVCAPLGGIGASCNHDCETGLYCRWGLSQPGDPFWGRCDEPESDSCISDQGCETLFCHFDQCIIPDPADTWCGVSG